MALMESAIREDLNRRATRVSAVINPVKLIVTNYPEGKTEELEAINNPEDPEAGSHKITFSRELWIERDDFMEDAPAKYFRLSQGRKDRNKTQGSDPEKPRHDGVGNIRLRRGIC